MKFSFLYTRKEPSSWIYFSIIEASVGLLLVQVSSCCYGTLDPVNKRKACSLGNDVTASLPQDHRSDRFLCENKNTMTFSQELSPHKTLTNFLMSHL